MIEQQAVLDMFAAQFGGRADVVVQSPGRVNLIGEHIDYNAGLVLPVALDKGTAIAARRREDRRVRLWAQRFGQTDSFDLDRVEQPGAQSWSNYVRGVAALLLARGVAVSGADIAIASDMPVGGGLSSSASLEVGAAMAFLHLAGAAMDPMDLARLCQQAENQYAGVPCGLMDQFAVVFGRAGQAIRLDCRSHEYQHVPCDHEAVAWMVIDSKMPRELAASGYAKRRAECDKSVAILQKAGCPISSLRDATLDMLEENEDRLGDALVRRSRHVITEIARVFDGSASLADGRYDLFGRQMYGSHRSMAVDYECTIDGLDFIVEAARDTLGVYGCRMTGGGWGGCAIALLAVEAAGFFRERLSAAYRARFNREPGCLVFHPSAGARVES